MVDKEQILWAICLVWEHFNICVDLSTGVGAAVLIFHNNFWERYLEHVDHDDGDNSNEKIIANAGVVLC